MTIQLTDCAACLEGFNLAPWEAARRKQQPQNESGGASACGTDPSPE